MYVARENGVWSLHSIEVPGSQLVQMTYSQRKRLIEESTGTFRAMTDQEWQDYLQGQSDEVADNKQLREQLRSLVANTSFAELEAIVENIWSEHTQQQRTFLLQLARVVLFLAKKEGGK